MVNAIVGEVSGTSISFGSATKFVTSIVDIPHEQYDPVNNKVVILYRTSGD